MIALKTDTSFSLGMRDPIYSIVIRPILLIITGSEIGEIFNLIQFISINSPISA